MLGWFCRRLTSDSRRGRSVLDGSRFTPSIESLDDRTLPAASFIGGANDPASVVNPRILENSSLTIPGAPQPGFSVSAVNQNGSPPSINPVGNLFATAVANNGTGPAPLSRIAFSIQPIEIGTANDQLWANQPLLENGPAGTPVFSMPPPVNADASQGDRFISRGLITDGIDHHLTAPPAVAGEAVSFFMVEEARGPSQSLRMSSSTDRSLTAVTFRVATEVTGDPLAASSSAPAKTAMRLHLKNGGLFDHDLNVTGSGSTAADSYVAAEANESDPFDAQPIDLDVLEGAGLITRLLPFDTAGLREEVNELLNSFEPVIPFLAEQLTTTNWTFVAATVTVGTGAFLRFSKSGTFLRSYSIRHPLTHQAEQTALSLKKTRRTDLSPVRGELETVETIA